jgi:hypothetical protein
MRHLRTLDCHGSNQNTCRFKLRDPVMRFSPDRYGFGEKNSNAARVVLRGTKSRRIIANSSAVGLSRYPH